MGFELATFRFLAQRSNHKATLRPWQSTNQLFYYKVIDKVVIVFFSGNYFKAEKKPLVLRFYRQDKTTFFQMFFLDVGSFLM